MPLGQSIEYFKQHHSELVRDHHGKVALIHNDHLEGIFDNDLEADLAAKEKFRPRTFIIQLSIAGDEETPVILHSRVAV